MDGVTTVTDRGVPPDVTWWRTANGTAHAFRDAAGFTQTVCGIVVPATALVLRYRQCPDCELLVDGAPVTESEARLLDGNR